MNIKVYRGKQEGVVTYEVDCFIKKDNSEDVCACLKDKCPKCNVAYAEYYYAPDDVWCISCPLCGHDHYTICALPEETLVVAGQYIIPKGMLVKLRVCRILCDGLIHGSFRSLLPKKN